MQVLEPNQRTEDAMMLGQFSGWYDLIVTTAGDPSFNYRLAGHVENGWDSTSDPALGMLTLKG
jgi:phospholipase C